ncbi:MULTISPECIES: regulator [Serratia]|uniref:Regulator n=1 Tax=Serratia liquefaciens TaxID=614 RepID=A0A515D456_SERLI|nr:MULTISPECIES: regulator [Serratia]NGH08779.1 regulator [Serratia marcescens]QDL35160.1 regulator [Serratia liquefaciens]
MRPNITISIPEPFLPLAEYRRRTGLSKSTAEQMIRDGRLPVRKKDTSRGLVEVNMADLTVQALSACRIALNP